MNEKLAMFVTPESNRDPLPYAVNYSQALQRVRGQVHTVWVLESWSNLEPADGRYRWDVLDEKVDEAIRNGFQVGIRLQVTLCGNDERNRFIAVSSVPPFIDQDMRSESFQRKAVAFFTALAERYRGRAKYLAIGNSINSYFARKPSQWEGFKQVYPRIVEAVRRADPAVKVFSDLEYAEFYRNPEQMTPFLEYFSRTGDDGFGFIFHFVDPAYLRQTHDNFNRDHLKHVLDEMRRAARGKQIYLIESACMSLHPEDQSDLSDLQDRYVEMILPEVLERDEIIGFAWWLCVDARPDEQVPWDLKAGFGLFDQHGRPKPAWMSWKRRVARSRPAP